MPLFDLGPATAPRLGKADLHVHSSIGDGLDSPTDLLEYAERHTDLDLIAVTDHDEVEGSLVAAERARERGYRCQVIAGSEITTRHGHVIALFVTERFPALRSLEETLEAVHAVGGICLVPHPLELVDVERGAPAPVAGAGTQGSQVALRWHRGLQPDLCRTRGPRAGAGT